MDARAFVEFGIDSGDRELEAEMTVSTTGGTELPPRESALEQQEVATFLRKRR
jgi:hypothetical protein